jgi:hypothetical protein
MDQERHMKRLHGRIVRVVCELLRSPVTILRARFRLRAGAGAAGDVTGDRPVMGMLLKRHIAACDKCWVFCRLSSEYLE